VDLDLEPLAVGLEIVVAEHWRVSLAARVSGVLSRR
jgi:hypothetical protein